MTYMNETPSNEIILYIANKADCSVEEALVLWQELRILVKNDLHLRSAAKAERRLAVFNREPRTE